MSQNVLRNLGSDDIVEFLLAHGCYEGGTHGDDTVYYHPKNNHWGIRVGRDRKTKKSGYPLGTLLNIIRTLQKVSGIDKAVWQDWFREKRNI